MTVAAFYPAKLIYQTSIVAIGRHDWTISVYEDDGEIRIVPQWRFPGSHWQMPAELKTGIPPAALCSLLESDNLLKIAEIVRAAQPR